MPHKSGLDGFVQFNIKGSRKEACLHGDRCPCGSNPQQTWTVKWGEHTQKGLSASCLYGDKKMGLSSVVFTFSCVTLKQQNTVLLSGIQSHSKCSIT
jgi:hypothetical protein